MSSNALTKRRVIFIAIVLCLSVTVVPVAICADARWYIGASGGQSKDQDMYSTSGGEKKLVTELLEGGATSATATVTRIDDTDTGWKVFAGYQFNRNLAIEASYVDLGVVDGDGYGSVAFPPFYSGPYTATIEAEVDGFSLAGMGMLPIGEKFSLFGKVGAFYSNADISYKVRSPLLTVSGMVEENDTEITYGLGAKYDFGKIFSLRAEWERFAGVFTSDEHDFDLFSIGIQVNFSVRTNSPSKNTAKSTNTHRLTRK